VKAERPPETTPQKDAREPVQLARGTAGPRTRTQIDDVLTRTVGRLPAMWALAAAAAVYLVLGALAPLALDSGRAGTIALGFLGASWSLVVILAALLAAQSAAHRRLLIEWTSDLRKLDALEFEWLVGEVLRREGWAVVETGRRDAPDGGVDLRATQNGRTLAVQCKRWTAAVVGVDEVRKIAGVATAPVNTHCRAAVVTLSEFGEQAITEAHRLGVELVDGKALLARIERVRNSEPCPRCSTPMIVDRSARGWWLRCPVYPRCNGKRDLGTNAGAAVDLLTS
jgi:HJR/Mrr/RecB family endonuclease